MADSRRWMLAFALAAVGATACAARDAHERQPTRVEPRPAGTSIPLHGSGSPITTSIWPLQLTPASPSDSAPSYARPYASEAQSSRVAARLAKGSWREKWSSPFEAKLKLRPAFVVAAGGRVAVQGESLWQLHDAATGRAVGNADRHGGDVVLDRERSLAYVPDPDDDGIDAHAFADKRNVFGFVYQGAGEGHVFAQSLYYTRRGNRFLVVTGAERGPDDRPIDSALAVLLRLPDGAHQGIVDTTVDGEAGFDDGRIKAAVSGQVLVLALPNQLVYSRLDGIEAGRPLGALFVPLALSLDEAANAYLIVERGKTQRYLWAVTREGNRFIELPLPAGAVVGPPLVAHDHRVFVLRAKSVLAVGQPGKILWQTSVGGSLGGALVSGDDRLVASIETPSGVEVVTFDDAGKATSLFRLPGESRPTPPALGEDGDLYLATESLDDQKRPTAILRRFTAR